MSWAKITRVSAVITTDIGDIVLQPHEGRSGSVLILVGNQDVMEVNAQDLLEAVAAITQASYNTIEEGSANEH